MARKPGLPWDERPAPSPIPEQVKIPTPWDERVDPALPIPRPGKREKPKRGL
jgi:hypothetical protein